MASYTTVSLSTMDLLRAVTKMSNFVPFQKMLELQPVLLFKGFCNLKLTRMYQNNTDVSVVCLLSVYIKYLKKCSFQHVCFDTLSVHIVDTMVRLHRFQASAGEHNLSN